MPSIALFVIAMAGVGSSFLVDGVKVQTAAASLSKAVGATVPEVVEKSNDFVASWFGRPMTCRLDHCAIVCEGDQAVLNYCKLFPQLNEASSAECRVESDACTLSCAGQRVGNVCQAISNLNLVAEATSAHLRGTTTTRASVGSERRRLGNVYRLLLEQQGTKWENGLVCYQMSKDVDQSMIFQAMDTWTLSTGIQFQACGPESGTSCCASPCRQYVHFVAGDGCWSYIGQQSPSTCASGGQTLSVASDCSQGNVMHEIGHAIGLLHEHTRTDREEHIRIVFENIKPLYRSNFEITDASTGRTENGPYDYGSIMHYGATAFAVDESRPTVVAIDADGRERANADMGQRQRLSRRDVDTVLALYGLERPPERASAEVGMLERLATPEGILVLLGVALMLGTVIWAIAALGRRRRVLEKAPVESPLRRTSLLDASSLYVATESPRLLEIPQEDLGSSDRK